MNQEERGSWYLLTGVIIGIALGILYTRLLQPVRYIDTTPDSLSVEYKNQYRALIAGAFLANGDLVRAKARLELLNDADIFRALTEQAQQTLAQNGSSDEARALGLLAIALGQPPPGQGQAVTQVPQSPTATRLLSTPVDISAAVETAPQSTLQEPPAIQDTSQPVLTSPAPPTAAAESAPITPDDFVLLSKTEICDQALQEPVIRIEVSDNTGQPMQGILIIVTWAGGEERFFTGLKPEIGLGYADYSLDPNFVYRLRLGENGAPLGNLTAVSCKDNQGNAFWGALFLKYGQP